MSEYKNRIVFVVKAGDVEKFNSWFKTTIDKSGGENTFTSGLNTDGDSKKAATVYWCCTAATDDHLLTIAKMVKSDSKDSTAIDAKSKVDLKKYMEDLKTAKKPTFSYYVFDNNGTNIDIKSILEKEGVKQIAPSADVKPVEDKPVDEPVDSPDGKNIKF